MPVAKQIKVPVDEAKTTKAIVNLNDYVQRVGRDLHFSVDKDSGKTIIKVMDSETRQLIRQIPPEEVLALAEYLELAEGIESTGFMEEA